MEGRSPAAVKPRRLFELIVVYPFLTVALFLIVLVAAMPRW